MRRKNHRIIQSIAIGIICLILLLSAASFYMRHLDENITAEITTNLKEVSNKNAAVIQSKMKGNLNVLESLAKYIKNNELDNIPAIVERLAIVSNMNGFKRMGVATLDGDCYTSDGYHINITEREYFQKAKQGEANISDVLYDLVSDKGLINAYAVPIYQNEKVAAVLFMVKGTQDVAKNLLVTSFGGNGYSLLCDQDGAVVLRSKVDKNTYGNLNELTYDEAKSEANKKTGVALYHDKNGSHYMAYTALGVNDWVVVSIVPSSIVSAQISSFSKMAVFTWGIIILVFMVLLLYIYLSWHRNHAKMQKILFKDTLTGYDNFNKFKIDVEELLEQQKEVLGALIELDIDDFKMFNKIHGYEIGDELLKDIMSSIHLRCTSDERCAHISDDRFVLYWNEQEESMVTKRIDEIYAAITMMFDSNDKHAGIKFQLHFGVYLMDTNNENLMKSLDKAIYAKNYSKKNHDCYISFYNEEMYLQVLKEKDMIERMDLALEKNEFVVYLQPKVNVDTFHIVAAEALVRWQDPSLGLIPPGDFIPLFERNGDLYKLDFFVIETVCQTLARWQREKKKMITISVNISKSYIFTKGFAKHLFDIVERNQIHPKYLELEITESTMIENPKDLLTVMDELKSYGFKISMDDFGSGYSSLNMLKEVPIDVIKIDQVFFRNTKDNTRKSNIIVAGLCQLIDMLHIETVAEGIETKEQLQFLQRVKCHIAQGFYFYRPMPIDDLEEILNKIQQT